MAKKNEKGGGARKYSRNKKWCEAYRARGQREVNKAIRLAKHLHRLPGDGAARATYDGLPELAKRAARGRLR